MDSTHIYQYAKLMSASLKAPKSLEPILTPGYELRPCFIKLIREQSFSGEGDENPYSHLQEFDTDLCMLVYRWHVYARRLGNVML